MKIRLASLADLDDLQALVAGFREVLGRSHPDDETLRGNLKNLLLTGDAEFFIAINDASEAMGYVQQRYRYSIWLSGLEATLEDLYVIPFSRRKGVGTYLVQFAVERAKEKRCRLIKLDTNERNKSAIDLYEKVGFRSGSSRFSGSRQLLLEKTLENIL